MGDNLKQQEWETKTFPSAKRPSLYTEKEIRTEGGLIKKINVRKQLPPERRENGDLIFANVDSTYRIVPIDEIPHQCLSDKYRIYKDVIKEVPVIDIYGVTKNEHSVTAHVWGAEPYFYVSCTVSDGDTEKDLCHRVKHRLQCIMMGIDPDSTNFEQIEKTGAYAKDYSRLMPGERNLTDLDIPDGIIPDFKVYVMDVSIIDARSIYGVHERDRKFFKITMASPRMVTTARKLFQDPKYQRFKKPQYGSAIQTFESNVAFVTRQMCDRRIRGMHWLKAKWVNDTRVGISAKVVSPYPYILSEDICSNAESYLSSIQYGTNPDTISDWLRENFGLHKSESTSQIEFDVLIDDVEGIPDDTEYKNKLPPLRIWSLDIEVANSVRGMFPSATNIGDMFITGCGVAYHLSESETPFDVTAFVLGGVEGDMEVNEKWGVKETDFHVYSYKSEALLFEGLQSYIRDLDPDVISGFNIFGFDMKYLHDRAKYLKLTPEQWGYYGRSTIKPTRTKRCTFQSNAYGRKDFDICIVTGRGYLDVLETMQRDYTCKFRGYTLNNCAKEILGEQKEDVPFWKITPMYTKNGEARKKMVSYCVTDAYLPPRMEEKKGHAVLYVQQARLYGVSVTELILRGQQHRVLTFMINFCLDLEREGEPKLLIPKNARISTGGGKRSVQFEGATVVEPEKGFYENPVATIDFKSLYPSIMLAHNLCYSTFVPPHKRKYYSEDQYFVSPSDDAFLYPHIKEGVLPKMLKELLGARSVAKKQMANAKNPIEKAMYNAKQIALKTGANSVYGFTGAGVGSLPCFAVSRTVTAYGRQYIHMTKAFVEQMPMLSDPEKYPLSDDIPVLKVNSDNGLKRDGPLPWLVPDENGVNTYSKEYWGIIEKYISPVLCSDGTYKAPYRCIYGDTGKFRFRVKKKNVMIKKTPLPLLNTKPNQQNFHSFLPQDSVMILMPYLGYEDTDESVRVGKVFEFLCNAILYPEPVEMEWEKNYIPYLLLMKKKYIGLLWMCTLVKNIITGKVYDLAIPLYIDAKGVMSVRRDNAPIESNLVKLVQNVLMGLTSQKKVPIPNLETVPPKWKPEEKPKPVYALNPMKPDVKLAETIIKERISSMASGEIDLREFTITKALSRREEDYTNLQPHVKVNQDIRKRKPGTEYPLGARIPYVIGATGERTSTLNAQDPLYMAEKGIDPDIKYYRDRLSKPLVQIMAPVLYPEKFKTAARRSKEMEKFLNLGSKFDSNEEMVDVRDDDYHITNVFMEDDEDDDLAEEFVRLNTTRKRKNISTLVRKEESRREITMEDFMRFNTVNNSTEDRIIKDTYGRLFLSGEKTRKKKSNVASKAKYDLDKKRKRGEASSSRMNVVDLLVVPEQHERKYRDDDDEKEAFKIYQDFREVINTLESIDAKTQKYVVSTNSEIEEDAFQRGTEIFKDIANPREGCARMIQYDWGSKLETRNKRKSFKSMAPLQYKKASNVYFPEGSKEPIVISSSKNNIKKKKRKTKYVRSRDKFSDLPEGIKLSDINIKKKVIF